MNPTSETIPPAKPDDLSLEAAIARLYRKRFPSEFLARRDAVWRVLCQNWFPRYIPAGSRILEIAAGYCEFINNIAAVERVVVDLNPETRQYAEPGVIVHEIAAEDLMSVVSPHYFDIVFMSNFLEHCRTRDQIMSVLRAAASALKPGGKLLILGPNFRYAYKQYFDFFDHHLPLTELSVAEALHLAGFHVEVLQARTLPYSFRGLLPTWPWLVWLYIRLPMFWRFFGAQFFVVASTPKVDSDVPRGTR